MIHLCMWMYSWHYLSMYCKGQLSNLTTKMPRAGHTFGTWATWWILKTWVSQRLWILQSTCLVQIVMLDLLDIMTPRVIPRSSWSMCVGLVINSRFFVSYLQIHIVYHCIIIQNLLNIGPYEWYVQMLSKLSLSISLPRSIHVGECIHFHIRHLSLRWSCEIDRRVSKRYRLYWLIESLIFITCWCAFDLL